MTAETNLRYEIIQMIPITPRHTPNARAGEKLGLAVIKEDNNDDILTVFAMLCTLLTLLLYYYCHYFILFLKFFIHYVNICTEITGPLTGSTMFCETNVTI